MLEPVVPGFVFRWCFVKLKGPYDPDGQKDVISWYIRWFINRPNLRQVLWALHASESGSYQVCNYMAAAPSPNSHEPFITILSVFMPSLGAAKGMHIDLERKGWIYFFWPQETSPCFEILHDFAKGPWLLGLLWLFLNSKISHSVA